MELIIFFGMINQGLLQMITLALLSFLWYYAISCQRTLWSANYILIYTVVVTIISITIWTSDLSIPILFVCFAIIGVILQAAVVFANLMLLKYVRAIESENFMNNINIDFHKRAIKTILFFYKLHFTSLCYNIHMRLFSAKWRI